MGYPWYASSLGGKARWEKYDKQPEGHGEKISAYLKGIDVSNRNVLAWRNRRNTYVVVWPDGKRSRTVNLTKFCKRYGLAVSHLCRISRYHEGQLLNGSRYYKGIDCWKQGHKVRRT